MKRAVIPALATTLALSACTVFGIRSGTAEPRYDTIGQVGPASIRTYAPRLAAETTITGTEEQARYEGFRRLAGFIFGANRTSQHIEMSAPVAQAPATSERIAMTAPVAQQQDAPDRWTIRFFMPANYTAQTLPVPTDPQVHIVAIPAETYAVLRFSGIPAPSIVAEKQADLLRALAGSPWHPIGTEVTWFYDPPWTIPFLRRNEVAVPVAHAP